MSRNPYVGSGRQIEGGALATRKQDFNAHVDGTGFRQLANTVDVSTIEGVSAANVQEALESLTGLITSAGSGFISIGLADGYAQGSYTVGTDAYPSLRDAFNGAFGDPRLANGGVVLVLAGTYKTSATITIPSGITVMGEMGGTIIVGETPDLPMFQIQGTANRITVGGNNGSGALPLDSSSKLEAVKFINLTLIDNLDGYAAFGQTSMSTAPMVRVAINSNFTCEFVRFIGRITDNTSYQTCTAHAIRSQVGSSSGTHLKLHKCFFDGINVPIYWTPAGTSDSFIMDGCRARVFSKGDSQASENCFVAFTECDATFTGNEIHEGGATALEFAFVLTETYGGNCTLTITGNHGYTSYRVSNIIFCEQSNYQAFNAVLSGNSWGNSVGTGWYVVAGLDFVGEGALDVIIGTAIPFVYLDVILLNTLEFKVTSNGSEYLRLHGGTVNLDVASGNDTAVSSNRRFEINSAQGTKFKCSTADTSFFHTVVCGWGASSASADKKVAWVDSCHFIDCGLRFLEVAAGTLENESTQVVVSNCQFYQTDSYAANYSLLMPSASITILENTKISGSGYAGGIGESSTYDSNASSPLIIMRGCSLIANRGVSIENLSPIVGTNDYWWWISDSTATVVIDDCIITPGRPDSTLTSNASYSKAIYIKALNVKVTNSNFKNNDDVFTVSSVSYQLPMLFVEPLTSLAVDKCDFTNTSLALQVGGSTAFTVDPTGATITNCNFNTDSDYSTTSIDFDIDLNSVPTTIPRIKIDGNIFSHIPGDGASYPVYHTEATNSFFDTLAGVMIYANLFDVVFTNNTLYSVIETGNFTKVSGVMINNSQSNTQSNQKVTNTVFADNKIYVTSRYDAEEDMEPLVADAVSIITPVLHMHNNTISMYPDVVTLGDVQNRIMTLDLNSSQGVAEGLVTSNVFTTRDQDGNVGLLNSEFIYIASGSNSGIMRDNIFTDEVSAIVNLGTEEVDDNSSDGWLIYNNKNQVVTTALVSSTGNFAVTDTSLVSNQFLLAGYDGQGVASRITGSSTSGSSGVAVTYGYWDTGDTIRFDWIVQAMDCIPYGAIITSIAVKYTLNVTLTTTRTLILTITSLTGTDTSSITIADNSQHTLTRTATMTHLNTPSNRVRFAVSALMQDANETNLTITEFTVTYKW